MPPMTPPSADEFYEMFLGEGTEPIEWSRIAPFQDLCIRLLAESGLDDTQKPTMVQSEITYRLPELSQPRRGGFHVFVSKHNPNGAYVMEEVKRALTEEKGTLLTTDDAERMRECECFLVYLTALTWTSGEASEALAQEEATAEEDNMLRAILGDVLEDVAWIDDDEEEKLARLKFGTHDYTMADEQTIAAAREAFRPFQEYFGVASEV